MAISRAQGRGPKMAAGRERRESERVIAYWEEKRRELGADAAVGALGLDRIGSPEWSNRFLIAADPVIEQSLLLMYGHNFAALLELPERPRTDLPLLRQVPPRYGSLFRQGCTEVRRDGAPVRLEGEVARDDGRVEQYRAGFIPVGVKPQALTWLAFGAFNSRTFGEGLAD
jgi:hypothetical protein